MRFAETLGLSHDVIQLERVLTQRINAALAPLGLSSPKYALLSVIEAQGAMTNADLARACAVTPQTMNRLTSDLEAGGHLQREADKSHGLRQLFTLTEKALAAVCSAHSAVNAVEMQMVQGLEQGDIDKLKALLKAAERNL